MATMMLHHRPPARPRRTADPAPSLSIVPSTTGPGPAAVRLLRPDAMVAVPLEPGEQVDARWVARMRGPYTSHARQLVTRAVAAPAGGPSLAAHRAADPVPTWAREAAAGHRGLLDALGVDLPLGPGAPARDGSVLIQHVVPSISYGWYLVTTVHATADAVLLVGGTYAEHRSDEAPFPVRWS
jgi:hypothetical protein